MSTKAGGTDHLFLFTYGNFFLIYCGFRFNIQYLFIYLFKAMWTKTSRSDHLFLFTYANVLLIVCSFSFNIYYIIQLFIYSKQCQQKQVEETFITASNEVGARLYFYMCLWICPELVAAKTCMVGKGAVRILLECFVVYLSKLVVVIYFYKSIFRMVLHLELIGGEDWESVVKYWHVNKEKKWNECQVKNQFFQLNIFWHLNSNLWWVH